MAVEQNRRAGARSCPGAQCACPCWKGPKVKNRKCRTGLGLLSAGTTERHRALASLARHRVRLNQQFELLRGGGLLHAPLASPRDTPGAPGSLHEPGSGRTREHDAKQAGHSGRDHQTESPRSAGSRRSLAARWRVPGHALAVTIRGCGVKANAVSKYFSWHSGTGSRLEVENSAQQGGEDGPETIT
jgi:hypothetical protein